MLCRCDLVVLGLGINTQLPQLFVKVLHVSGNSCLDGAEVVVLKLLTLRCGCTEQCPACEDQILSVRIHLSVNEEVFLLGTHVCHNSCCIGTEQLENSQCRTVNSFHRPQQRCFLIQCLTVV